MAVTNGRIRACGRVNSGASCCSRLSSALRRSPCLRSSRRNGDRPSDATPGPASCAGRSRSSQWGCFSVVGARLISGPGIAYFSYATGSAARAGAMLGLRALPVWAAQSILGFGVAARLVDATQPASEVAVFVLGFPMTVGLAGVGVVAARSALAGYVGMAVAWVAAAQGSAASTERVRLARELHDSLASALRGITFAALDPARLNSAPPRPCRTARWHGISRGRGGGQGGSPAGRRSSSGQPEPGTARNRDPHLPGVVDLVGTPGQLDLDAVDPPIAVSYELTRLLHEALVNVERHVTAGRVTVESRDLNRLVVIDDGIGPPQERALRHRRHGRKGEVYQWIS